MAQSRINLESGARRTAELFRVGGGISLVRSFGSTNLLLDGTEGFIERPSFVETVETVETVESRVKLPRVWRELGGETLKGACDALKVRLTGHVPPPIMHGGCMSKPTEDVRTTDGMRGTSSFEPRRIDGSARAVSASLPTEPRA